MFRDRVEAGKRLAEVLRRYGDQNPIVLGMARGGVVLAGQIAKALGGELDVLAVRKIGAPSNPEYGVGAVAPNRIAIFDNTALASLGLTQDDLKVTVARETAEIERRLAIYRHGLLPLDLSNRTVIIVDDGLATGISAVCAARYAKSLRASYIVFAAPVCSRPGIRTLEEDVDEIVCLKAPEVFWAVGMWYENFEQVEDEEVIRSLDYARRREFLA